MTAVIDLDGTLLRGNSLEAYTRWAVKALLRRGLIHRSVLIVAWVALRRMRVVCHRRMKWHILRLGRALDTTSLLDILQGMTRPEVAAMIDPEAVLATAADGWYAVPLARRFGFRHILATEPAEHYRDYIECRGSIKARRVKNLVTHESLTVGTVVTDHPDDLPLFDAFPQARHILINS